MSELRDLLGGQLAQSNSIREAIRDELDAINKYNTYMANSEDERVIKVFADIRDEEKVHVGELLKILYLVEPDLNTHLTEGEGEVDELVAQANEALGSK